MITPVVLNAVTNLATGETKRPLDERALISDRSPMLVDEIRFRVISNSTGKQAGMAIRAKVSVSGIPLINPMRGGVPIPALGRIRDYSQERSGTNGLPTNVGSGAGYSEFYRWKFREPMLISAREQIDTELFYDPELRATAGTSGPSDPDVTVHTIVAGRSLPLGYSAVKRTIPFCSHFWSGQRAPSTTPAQFHSQPQDFINPFDVPLRLQRFGFSPNLQSMNSVQYRDVTEALFDGLITARMTDERGGVVVRDWTPLGHLFQYIETAWGLEGSILLNRREGFKMTFQTKDTSGIAQNVGSWFGWSIGMIGDREVPYVD